MADQDGAGDLAADRARQAYAEALASYQASRQMADHLALKAAYEELRDATAFWNGCDPDLTDYAVLRVAAAEARMAAELRRALSQKAGT
jgi:hypothetical protein